MEPSVFLSGTQQSQPIKILSWNVVRTKLEKPEDQTLLLNYDIITEVLWENYLIEVVQQFFVKDYLARFITHVDTSIREQVWTQFSFTPRTLFGFCYIPPSDSPNYLHSSFATSKKKLNLSNQ